MKNLFRILLVITLVFCFTGISAAGDIQKKLIDESTIEKIIKSGKMRVGMSTFVPWAMQDKSGKWIGFEIDVATQLAEDMGVKLELVPTKWDGLIPSLITGKLDVIIAGMAGTPERALKINFTIPYDHSVENMVANKELAAGFTNPEDFNKKGVTVITRLGVTANNTIDKLMPLATKREFPDEGSLVQELLNGKAHAILISAPLPAFTALKYPDTLFLVPTPLASYPISFGVRKGDPDTLAYFNNWITVKRDQGWLKDTAAYWFQSQEWKSRIQ